MLFYTHIIKPFLFRQDPERVHEWAVFVGRWMGKWGPARACARRLWAYQHPPLRQTIDGTEFPNPIGLSAGFDKNAELLRILPAVGFGFVQVGTITDQPYVGNPKPRLTRLPKSRAIMVNYGLKNEGAERILGRIQNTRPQRTIPLSLSIGKTNSQSAATCELGIADQIACLQKVMDADVGDWYTLNISCPNTFGGEPFTDPDSLSQLLSAWFAKQPPKPTYLKMPINLPWEEFRALLEVAKQYGVRGVIIGNLQKDHRDPSLVETIAPGTKGGISGLPTKQLSNQLIRQTYAEYGSDFIIVGVGGVFSAEDAYEKIKLGASLVQLITGMIYRGPALVGHINRGLVCLLEQDGFASIGEAIGAAHRA